MKIALSNKKALLLGLTLLLGAVALTIAAQQHKPDLLVAMTTSTALVESSEVAFDIGSLSISRYGDRITIGDKNMSASVLMEHNRPFLVYREDAATLGIPDVVVVAVYADGTVEAKLSPARFVFGGEYEFSLDKKGLNRILKLAALGGVLGERTNLPANVQHPTPLPADFGEGYFILRFEHLSYANQDLEQGEEIHYAFKNLPGVGSTEAEATLALEALREVQDLLYDRAYDFASSTYHAQ